MRWPTLLVPLLLAGCAPPEPCSLTLAARIPFITLPNDARVMLPVKVDRKTGKLLLDTGADTTVLTDDAFARLAGLERARHDMIVSGVGGVQQVRGADMWRFSLGVLASQLSIVVLDHSILPPVPPTDGLLGMDALAGYDMDFDLAGGHLNLFTAGGNCTAPQSLMTGRTWQLDLLDNGGRGLKPHFDVEIAGQHLVGELDTGAPNTVLFAHTARRLGLPAATSGARVSGIGTSEALQRQITLPRLKLGAFTLRDMPATVLDQDLMEPVDLLLGVDFIHLVHVWYAASSHTIILQYPPAPTPLPPG